MASILSPDLPMSARSASAPRLSVVVPAFNEEAVLDETHRRIRQACLDAVGSQFEIIYVDDGSKDGTWPILQALAERDACVVAATLSRNFGHQQALTAGLSLARGEWVLCIDADLQDPPELLGRMVGLIEAGHDVVYGVRTSRAGETRFKRATASAFYRLLRHMTEVDIPVDTGDFRLMRREVVQALLAMPEQHRFVRGLVAWLGFRQTAIEYARDARFAGETKYPLKRMLRLAADAMTGFSIRPLRMATWLALGCFALAAGFASWALVQWILGSTIPGWTSVIVIVAFLSSVQLLCLGVLGEYIGRLFMESKRRPLAIIRELRTGARAPVASVRTSASGL